MTLRLTRGIGCVFLAVAGLVLGVHHAGHPAGAQNQAVSGAVMDAARNDVELLEAQLEVHKALVEEAAVRLKVAKEFAEVVYKAPDSVPIHVLAKARGEKETLEAQLKVKQAEQRVAEVRLKHAQRRLAQLQGKKDMHDGWWCDEHGMPEEECSMCSLKAAKEFKAKGDWCKKHDRAKSQCFICDPSLREKFAKVYKAREGKDPPEPKENMPKSDTPKKE